MRGIPYWGNNTFIDFRNIDSIEECKCSIEMLNELLKNSGEIDFAVTDVYSLFLGLGKLDLLFLIEGSDELTYLSWCRDTRFNYRDRKLFIPYFEYDSIDVCVKRTGKEDVNAYAYCDITDDILSVKYNYKLCECVLEDIEKGLSTKTVKVYDFKEKKIYNIDFTDLPYITENSFSLEHLHKLYFDSCYYNELLSEDLDFTRYSIIKWKDKKNKDFYYRKKYGLSAYADGFIDIRYSDMRGYTYEELYGTKIIDILDEPYWLRRNKFEGYLYCIMRANLGVQEIEYKDLYDRLGKDMRFLSFREKGVTLILKYYYKDNFSLRRKSYERYRD